MMMRATVAELEKLVEDLGNHFEAPKLVDVGGIIVFRHKNQNDLLLSWLKCVRAISSLNACLHLLDRGYVQEVGALCRCIDEFFQDVMFLATPLGDNGMPSEQQKRLVNEFFQEEFKDYSDPLSAAQDRNRVPRSKVVSGIARIKGQPVNANDAQRMHEVINSTFSGYVHGAYCHIMEMYGITHGKGRFYTGGFVGTPRVAEWSDHLGDYVYRTLLASEVVAKRCGDAEILRRLQLNREAFEAKSGRGKDDPNRILRRMKSAKSGKES